MNESGQNLQPLNQPRRRTVKNIGLRNMNGIVADGGDGRPLPPPIPNLFKNSGSIHGRDNHDLWRQSNNLFHAKSRIGRFTGSGVVAAGKCDQFVDKGIVPNGNDR